MSREDAPPLGSDAQDAGRTITSRRSTKPKKSTSKKNSNRGREQCMTPNKRAIHHRILHSKNKNFQFPQHQMSSNN